MYLKPGNTGLLVKNCQYSLHILTYNVNGIDGSYGPGMESAVQLYQKNNGLAVSGIIDTATWNNIVANIYPIKLQLSHKGYYNYYTLDGIGNIDLYNAVKNFQSDNGLAVDGMVGPATRVKLYSEGTGNTVVGDDEFPLSAIRPSRSCLRAGRFRWFLRPGCGYGSPLFPGQIRSCRGRKRRPCHLEQDERTDYRNPAGAL